MEQFNGPDLNESCERRDSSIVPTQVFALFNSKFANDTALAFAARLGKQGAAEAAQIDRAYQLAMSRLPTPEERTLLLKHYARMVEQERKIKPAATGPHLAKVRSLVHELTGQKFDLAEKARPVTTKRTSSRRKFRRKRGRWRRCCWYCSTRTSSFMFSKTTRRDFLYRTSAGLGSLALSALLGREEARAGMLSPKPRIIPPKRRPASSS